MKITLINIGEIIKGFRNEQKKSQELLADECGFNEQSHLCQIECSKVYPRLTTIIKILNVLGYDLYAVKR